MVVEWDVPVTRTVQERSRMRGNSHVRFCSAGGVSHRRVVMATWRLSLTQVLISDKETIPILEYVLAAQ